MRKKTAVIASGAAALILAGSGIAWASIPGSDGVIKGCYRNSTGDLRVIDSGTCRTDESSLNWDQQGATGPVGPTGPVGSPATGSLVGIRTVVLTGVIPANTASGYHQFDCPSGYVLIDESGATQNGGDQAASLPLVGLTPSGDAGTDNEVATSAIYGFVNTSASDLGYQVFLTCAQRS